MNALLLATAFIALASPSKAPVKVHVDVKNGDVITGEHTFKVTVDSSNLVTQVEFYFNDDLRDKATSTPYKFTVDTLSESEGEAKVRFKAYTSEGETGEETVTVKVDNGMDKGADFHLAEASKNLQDGKWSDAIVQARITLKIDSKSAAARTILARAYMHAGAYDKAQKYAEDAVAAQPDNAQALDLLSVIKLQQAFKTFNKESGDRNETLKSIGEAMKNAVENRRKSLDSAADKMPAPTDQTLLAYSDSLLRAGRYSLAASMLSQAFLKDNRRTDVANRLAYAQIRLSRYTEALSTLTQLKKYGTLDAYSDATLAVLMAEAGNVQASDDAIKEAILNDADAPIVSTAQAYIALKFVRSRVATLNTMGLNYDDLSGKDTAGKIEARNTLSQILKQLAKDQGQRTEVNYYLCALNNKLENYDQARKYFEQAVLTEPTNYDAYIEQGNKSIVISQRTKMSKEDANFLYENARTMFAAALQARPSSAAALTGLSLVANYEGKSDEAVKWADAAVHAEPTFAPGFVALSSAFTLAESVATSTAVQIRAQGNKLTASAERADNEQKARQVESKASEYAHEARLALDKAQTLDSKISGSELTKVNAAWRYFNVGGRVPVLPMPN